MSKLIKGKAKTGEEVSILSPNICVYSFASNPQKLTFLELFYFFAQKLLTEDRGEEKNLLAVKKVLVELDNKVTALKYFSQKARKQGTLLFDRRNKKENICDYKPYQVFLGLLEGYLNTLHSLCEYLRELDGLLGQNFFEQIDQEDLYKISMDLRNIFHHNQSPALTMSEEGIWLVFERLPRSPRFFETSMKNQNGHYQVAINYEDLGGEMLKSFNDWAKKYIDLIDENETVDSVVGHYADGRMKSKKLFLKDLKKIIQKTKKSSCKES